MINIHWQTCSKPDSPADSHTLSFWSGIRKGKTCTCDLSMWNQKVIWKGWLNEWSSTESLSMLCDKEVYPLRMIIKPEILLLFSVQWIAHGWSRYWLGAFEGWNTPNCEQECYLRIYPGMPWWAIGKSFSGPALRASARQLMFFPKAHSTRVARKLPSLGLKNRVILAY